MKQKELEKISIAINSSLEEKFKGVKAKKFNTINGKYVGEKHLFLLEGYKNSAYSYLKLKLILDDLTISKIPVTKQLIDVFYQENPAAILAVQEVPDSEVERYGTVKYKRNTRYKYDIEEILEKMPLGKNPSNMAQFGRFVFSHKVIREVKKTKVGKDNELWITDVLNNLAKTGKRVIAQPILGEWMTTGDPLRYMKTQVKFALERKDIGKKFAEFLQSLNSKKN